MAGEWCVVPGRRSTARRGVCSAGLLEGGGVEEWGNWQRIPGGGGVWAHQGHHTAP